jgi:probable rRNA maturation factor
MLELVFQNFTKDKSFKRDFFEYIISAGIDVLNMRENKTGVSVNLVGEKTIKELNIKYRAKNKVTDVLSFPLSEKLEIGNWKLEILELGDIFICLPFAKKEAKSENIAIDRKLAQLTVHGFLHLLGYDHEGKSEVAKKMFGLETKILNKLNFS